MTNTVFDQIIQLIEEKIGLKPHSINDLVWEWVLKERMTSCRVASYLIADVLKSQPIFA
jgi:hypothetical protein